MEDECRRRKPFRDTDSFRAKLTEKQQKQLESLPKSKLDKLKDAFTLFDKDGDGTICELELSTVMSSLGWDPTENEIKDLIHDVDTNGNGKIEFPEFVDMMMKIKDEDPNLKECFKVFDKDGNGYITREELKNAMANLGEKLSEREIEDMINEADTNKDGCIDYNVCSWKTHVGGCDGHL